MEQAAGQVMRGVRSLQRLVLSLDEPWIICWLARRVPGVPQGLLFSVSHPPTLQEGRQHVPNVDEAGNVFDGALGLSSVMLVHALLLRCTADHRGRQDAVGSQNLHESGEKHR